LNERFSWALKNSNSSTRDFQEEEEDISDPKQKDEI
jgi:hypothetical protein